MFDSLNKVFAYELAENNHLSIDNRLHKHIVRFVKKSSGGAKTPFLILLKPFLIYLDTWSNKTGLLMNTIFKMIKKPE